MRRSAARLRIASTSKTLPRRTVNAASLTRFESTLASTSTNDVDKQDYPRSKATLFIDSVFPIRVGRWDFRPYLAAFREQEILDSLNNILKSVHERGFKVLKLERREKDGGVFVQFEYDNTPSPDHNAPSPLSEVKEVVRSKAKELGGVPSWLSLRRGDVWVVQGEPWSEDMHRYASSVLKVEFEGPDVHQEKLYQAFRPFGKIDDISRPTPVPAGALRSSTISFAQIRSAVRAQNCLHGLALQGTGANTRLAIAYEQTIKGHVVRDWLSSHPRIVLPVLAFLLGTLTYTVFDPVRSFMVQAKVENWFDYRDYKAVQWLRRNTIDKLSINFSSQATSSKPNRIVWEERKQAEGSLEKYLDDIPTTVAFLHGPAGSGKSSLVARLVSESERPTIVIDCAAIYNASSDAALLRQVASQTGYFPVFSGLAWVNSMIDLASVGLIGQKAGFSKSLDDQLKEILDVVGAALKRVNASHATRIQTQLHHQQALEKRQEDEKIRREALKRGIFHDPRLDCVSGNGIMSELGIGDENLEDATLDAPMASPSEGVSKIKEGDRVSDVEEMRKALAASDADSLKGLPIVVLKNFDAKGASKREAILDVFSNWSTALVENQIAHVVVSSDNRESSKRLAKSLGSKPLATIALTDADSKSALSLVQSRLGDSEMAEGSLSPSDRAYIARLGGRSSDLDALVYKVKNGQSIEEAVEDIIIRTMGELRKNAFGDDNEDAKSLPWKREQVWAVVQKLATHSEIAYSDTLIEFPFKGDDAPLKEMEKAELISIVTDDGFPVSIRPGRPVYRYVFERLVDDPLFRAVQEIATNEKLISAADSTIHACEDELLTLRNIGMDAGKSIWHGKGATGLRAEALLKKMEDAVLKMDRLEKTNARLKKTLASEGYGRGQS